MLSVSSLIDFLMSLLRDDDLRAEFERNPDQVLARHGLEGVTAEDVRDAAPLLADCSGTRISDGGGGGGGGADDGPATVIRKVVEHHRQEPDVVVKNVHNEYAYEFDYHDHYYDYRGAVIDSYNQDNDFVDNKGGEIDDSVFAGRDVTGSGNTTTVEDSDNSSGVPVAPAPTVEPAPLRSTDDLYPLATPVSEPGGEGAEVEGGEL